MAGETRLHWRLRRLRRFVPRLIIDAGKGVEDSVLLVGGGRTGTTWVSNVINWRNNYRYMYEPFHGGNVQISADFTPHIYLRPDNADPRYLEPARRIFTGQIRDWWIDHQNRRIYARKRLIKDVNTMLALRWVHERFRGMPIVVLMRHPFATAVSRMQMQWSGRVGAFLDQPDLVEDHLKSLADALRAEDDVFMRQLIFWCIDYAVCLRQFRRGEIYVAFYERISTHPEAELPGLCKFLGVAWDPRMIDATTVPSIQAKRSRRATPSAIVSGGDVLAGWRKHVTPERLARGTDLLKRFGLDTIYGDADTPDPEAAYALMRS